MPDEVDGHVVATDTALKIMAHLLHRRGALDVDAFAKEFEARAELLAKPEAGSDLEPAATRAAGVLAEQARILREPVLGPGTRDGSKGALTGCTGPIAPRTVTRA